ncbi:DUF1616 domain-containing protein [Halobacterium salinarum]|uniref:DUF1616 domain-containing protein n=1 Tax=Halobacterium salinarum TaxID=2242 RepID=UPI002556AD53|nr:DUF1616 domain-containing protein [Halobacterium salinarum]MDL0119418.1 DUF1616 domain-containing protein [Halobacterium salinarum]MDL0128290.1 DUF1616 domain-containing protein [Halobacterium salinarum]
MAGDSGWWLLVPEPIRKLPADLAAISILTCLTLFSVLVPVVRETPLRVVVGLPFVLFLPGYALIAALFPESGTAPDDQSPADGSADAGRAGEGRRGIDGIERVALSFGLSIAVVPLVGLVLNFTPFGIRLVPVLIAISGLILAFTGVAARRRSALPPVERFRVPYRGWIVAARSELVEPQSRMDAALNVLLVVSVVLAASSVAYAVVPSQGASFTEFYLLTERTDGTLVADDYPTEFTAGQPKSIIIGVGNQEHQREKYTVVATIQNVQATNNSTTVLDENELRRVQSAVGDNETWQQALALAPSMTGERLRLQFLLYRGSAPTSPSTKTAYRETHLWVNVSASNPAALQVSG